ncbi:uncharacterized protein Tco025E_01530 [Trypanosoma conorhini]|uniref:Uncharacterized protein n=1 Tax=Trypanosoma conorhini TaxID=83891 RepID=A0A422Q8B6_9TRYP|nr:uncharacterized protein Tco025E_01530 [Trypanosoma conorhini]RNF26222.1 hypothetical protein Tco025E_01530 [Trypanosoma conorhini]
MAHNMNTMPPLGVAPDVGGSCVGADNNGDGASAHPCDVSNLASVVLSTYTPEEAEGLPRQRDSFRHGEKPQEEEKGQQQQQEVYTQEEQQQQEVHMQEEQQQQEIHMQEEQQEEVHMQEEQQEEAGAPPAAQGGPCKVAPVALNAYGQLLLRRSEELLRVQTEFELYTERIRKLLEKRVDPDGPHPVELQLEDEVELPSRAPSMLSLLVRCSLAEPEVGSDGVPVVAETAPSPPPTSRPTTGRASPSSYAAMYGRPPPHEWTAGASQQYEKMLQSHEKELMRAAAGYQRYAAELASQFKRPPVDIPAHLVNSFADTNVIAAKDHQGRMELAARTHSASADGLNTDGEGNCAELQQLPEGGELVLQQQESPPRFTIESLANGDLRERDALSGLLYWDAKAPNELHRALPSQLLDERMAEAVHNYRFYSHHWGDQLRELAAAVGGEQGAELLYRYETREESLPLPPKCRRDFCESAVDYDALLEEQGRLMAVVERNLLEYRAALLDKPRRAPQKQLPPVEMP